MTSPGARRVDAWLTRRGVVGVVRRDLLLAVVVAAATAALVPVLLRAAAEAGDLEATASEATVLTAVCTAQSLLLVVRRSRPVACLLLVAATQVVVLAVTPADVDARGPATLLAAYAVGSLLPVATTVRVVLVALTIEAAGELVLGVPDGGAVLALLSLTSAAVAYGGAALVGSDVRARRRVAALERERAAEAVAAQSERADAAVAAERTRMARDLHDIAAHHLSGMVVQATATARLVDTDPAATRAGLLAIRQQGRRTLDDLRLLVGVLRGSAVADDAPVPGAEVVDSLLADARSVGADVRLERSGRPVTLTPLADVTCYRLVQEALANARQHAPGAAVRVGLAGTADGLEVLVENDAPPSSVSRPAAQGAAHDGVGLLGMRERVQLVGGRLEVGPTGAGGWRVCAHLPAAASEEEGDRP